MPIRFFIDALILVLIVDCVGCSGFLVESVQCSPEYVNFRSLIIFLLLLYTSIGILKCQMSVLVGYKKLLGTIVFIHIVLNTVVVIHASLISI